MLGKVLDDSYDAEVRDNITLLTFTRFTGNAAYRFAVPFFATIASGLGVSIGRLGVGIAITELVALSAPLVGRAVERTTRRTAMSLGAAGVSGGALVAALSQHLVVFVVGLSLLSLSKVTFDIALGGWIADRVPWSRRSRVISLTETSWSLGLLLGVSVLALVVAVSSWHVAYAVIAAVVALSGVVLRRHLPAESVGAGHPHVAGRPVASDRPAAPLRRILHTALSVGLLAGAAQFMFVTYGSWLSVEFGFSAAQLAAVTFSLGALEMMSSVVSVRRTDHWGKERSMRFGACLMAPSALVLAAGAHHVWVLLPALGSFLMGFELAIISGLPLGAQLTPGEPARGLGMLIAGVTLSRAIVAVPATWWFERHGIVWPAIGAAAFATGSALLVTAQRPQQTAG